MGTYCISGLAGSGKACIATLVVVERRQRNDDEGIWHRSPGIHRKIDVSGPS